ncbi:MAG: STAS domain-containing protein [Rubinisphaera brasiliensis]|uniref:Sulfate transporter/antisigma-factor antagonist STAS n=1 Tax=Rubinisphaera brasiliensis (strain ATCC 49424 / DSM 5305 / JCM 21570 / IAM 15109 / NBRC 103401 / IFAM 1448) TaxID=756272 RepID=F0SSB2_RUBBR|nr:MULTISPECIES: STAS domain-containing protein [Rubinisphaera]ADY58123.1 sulfate transporter/antisigma-factor antagonist STAS [Rubinisphaera brasiliensis DSM 5305]MBB02017.1 anti-sigma factor antagonist [Planctomyces sp.]MBR9800385.1 STAS domain-containing protein [bacterium]
MARHLKIFSVEKAAPHLYVTPNGQGASFRYADLQMESNYVRTLVADAKCPYLIIDLSNMTYFGSEFIGALITLGREKKNRGGKVAICAANDNMYDVLKGMSLFKLWPYYASREEAVAAFAAD